MTENTETTHWEHVAWLCPRCGHSDDGPSRLHLVDSRDDSIDSRDVWEPDYDADRYEERETTEPTVVCPECKTVFDVRFEACEEGHE